VQGLLAIAALTIAVSTGDAHGEGLADLYRIDVSACADPHNDGAFGTGFLAHGLPGDRGAVVLVTALHVVYQCSDIRITHLDCHATTHAGVFKRQATVSPGQKILIWKEWDLAAIFFDFASIGGAASAALEVDFTKSSLKELLNNDTGNGSMVFRVDGTSKDFLCENANLSSLSVMNSTVELDYIARRTKGDPRALSGSLSLDAYFLNYSGPPTHGFSGAAVVRGNKVIGIHEGGYERVSKSWAILLVGSDLPAPLIASVTNWPPGFLPSLLEQSALLTDNDYEDARIHRSRVREAQNFFSLVVEGAGQARYHWSDGIEDGALGYLSFTRHPWVTPTEWGAFKFGFVLGGGVRIGKASQLFFSPTGNLLESRRVSLDQMFGRLGLNARFERLRGAVSGDLSLGILGGRWIHDGKVYASDRITDVALGVWSSGSVRLPSKVCFSIGGYGCLQFLVALDLSWQRTPSFEYTYSGFGGDALRAHDSNVVHFGVGGGIEW